MKTLTTLFFLLLKKMIYDRTAHSKVNYFLSYPFLLTDLGFSSAKGKNLFQEINDLQGKKLLFNLDNFSNKDKNQSNSGGSSDKFEKFSDNFETPFRKNINPFPSQDNNFQINDNNNINNIPNPTIIENNENVNINNIISNNNKNNYFPIPNSNDNSTLYYHTKKICNCTKTGCVKKYCPCYANGLPCNGCQCENCVNKMGNNSNQYMLHNYLNQSIQLNYGQQPPPNNIICNCTKSNCKKKYCECFKIGKECTWLCRCVNCDNCQSRRSEYHSFEEEGMTFEFCNRTIYFCKRKGGINFDVNTFDRETVLERQNDDFYTPMKMLKRKTKRNKNLSTDYITTHSSKSKRRPKKRNMPKKKLNI